MIQLILAGALLAVPAAAQGQKPVCEVIPESAAVKVAGSPIKQKVTPLGPDACSWSGERLFTVARMPKQPPDAIEGILGGIKGRAGAGAIVRDEPGLGDRAVSEVPAGRRGLELWVASGDTVWRFSVAQFAAGPTPEELLPALKTLAAAVVGKGA